MLFKGFQIHRQSRKLHSARPGTCQRAAEWLGEHGDERAVEPLVQSVLEEDDASVRRAALAALVKIARRGVTDVGVALVPAVAGRDFRAADVLAAVVEIGDWNVAEPLFAAANDTSNIYDIVRTLLKLDLARAIALLRDRADTLDWKQRFNISDMLRVSDPAVIPALVSALGRHTGGLSAFLESSISNTLTRFGESAIDPLIGLLKDPDPTVRGAAADVLDRIGSRRGAEPLVVAFEVERDPTTRLRLLLAASHKCEARDPRVVGPLVEMFRAAETADERCRFGDELAYRERAAGVPLDVLREMAALEDEFETQTWTYPASERGEKDGWSAVEHSDWVKVKDRSRPRDAAKAEIARRNGSPAS